MTLISFNAHNLRTGSDQNQIRIQVDFFFRQKEHLQYFGCVFFRCKTLRIPSRFGIKANLYLVGLSRFYHSLLISKIVRCNANLCIGSPEQSCRFLFFPNERLYLYNNESPHIASLLMETL